MVNKALEEFFGRPQSELLAKTDFELMPYESAQSCCFSDKLVLESNQTSITIEQIGEKIYETRKFPVKIKKGEMGVGAYIRDITERKQAELIIAQQNNQLKELIAAKDKFFSIIAHDLKSPFQGFLGLTQAMAEKVNDFSEKELTELGITMHQTANNLFTLLKNLLEWAQMQNGSISFEIKGFSLNDLIVENIEAIKERSRQKGITVVSSFSDSFFVYADEKMIRSVFLNLLSNAVKFTNRNGKVTVKVYRVENQKIEVSISDTGVGMQNSEVEKLFRVS